MTKRNIRKFQLVNKLDGIVSLKDLSCYYCSTCKYKKYYRETKLIKCTTGINLLLINYKINYKDGQPGRQRPDGEIDGVFHLYICHSHK
jgi:hypothetical protein